MLVGRRPYERTFRPFPVEVRQPGVLGDEDEVLVGHGAAVVPAQDGPYSVCGGRSLRVPKTRQDCGMY